MPSRLLDPLNDVQRAAVSTPPGPVLVLAGAGSGKTRVLTHRVAWLIATGAASPQSVLAVTFTNKAAREVRGRIETLCALPSGGGVGWVGTFHGLCHRLLRLHWQDAGLPQGFHVLDGDDQLRQVRRILRDLEMDESKFAPRQVVAFINSNKDEGRRASHLQPSNPYERAVARVYAVYEETCKRGGLVDFAELLLRAHELLRDNAPILAHYRGRFRHLLVDEFQDTNLLQYSWLRLLAGENGNLFVVGDDDQSIYGWRGARIENIHKFSNDFPNTKTFRLEQNYRSTATILDAANHLIAHNESRLGKKLWTAGETGDSLLLYQAFNDLEEANFVAERILEWIARSGKPNDCAILYRSNAQSRLFEQELSRAGVAFQVYGGLRFYERAEIKDTTAYLRLITNRDDDAAFERIVNTPTRAIGDRTLEGLRNLARSSGVSLWQAANQSLEKQELTTRAAHAVYGFLKLIEDLAETTATLDLHETVQQVVARVGLVEYYKKEDRLTAETREENLAELVNAAREYAQQDAETEQRLVRFLSEAALGIGEAEPGDDGGAVQLMTLHSAKGLEFPLVFMVGMEEDLFPSSRSIDNPARLEEERRLCYVGMTRAERQLVLTYAEQRRLYGSYRPCMPSRFLNEIPVKLVREVRLRGGAARSTTNYQQQRGNVAPPSPGVGLHETSTASPNRAPAITPAPAPTSASGSALRLGQHVRHPHFGEGVVLQLEGDGAKGRVQIRFANHGTKWLVMGYVPIQAL